MANEQKGDKASKSLFANLVMMFAGSALQQMGKLVNPLTNKAEVDMEGAQLSIDMLGMIEEKTKGNLDADEQRFLADTLASLRMNFVATAGSAGSPQAKAETKNPPAPGVASPAGEATPAGPETGSKEKEAREPKFRKSYG